MKRAARDVRPEGAEPAGAAEEEGVVEAAAEPEGAAEVGASRLAAKPVAQGRRERKLAAVAKVYDQVADRYDALFSPDETDAGETNEELKGLLGSPPSPVLDLACGTGFFLDLFPSFPRSAYTGIDISRGMLRVARRKHPNARFIHGSLPEADLPSARSVISLGGALSHLSPPDLSVLVRKIAPFSPSFIFLTFLRRPYLPDELSGAPVHILSRVALYRLVSVPLGIKTIPLRWYDYYIVKLDA